MTTTLSIPEGYRELRDDMGRPDRQIGKRLGLSRSVLERTLHRYKLPVSRALSEMVDADRARRRGLKAAS